MYPCPQAQELRREVEHESMDKIDTAHRESKDAGDPNGTPEGIEAGEDNLWLIRVPHSNTEGGQKRSPTHLQTYTHRQIPKKGKKIGY